MPKKFKFIALGVASVMALGATACGGSTMTDEQKVKGANDEFVSGIVRGNNIDACRATTDPKECVSQMGLAAMFLGGPEGLKEAMAEGASKVKTIKFDAAKKHADVIYATDTAEDEPTKFTKRGDQWLMVIEKTENWGS